MQNLTTKEHFIESTINNSGRCFTSKLSEPTNSVFYKKSDTSSGAILIKEIYPNYRNKEKASNIYRLFGSSYLPTSYDEKSFQNGYNLLNIHDRIQNKWTKVRLIARI